MSADLILRNGRFTTLDRSNPSATAVAIANGVFTAEVQVTDAANHTNVQSLPIRIGTINIITSPYRLVNGALNHAYNLQLMATGATPLTWSFPIALSPCNRARSSRGRAPCTNGFWPRSSRH